MCTAVSYGAKDHYFGRNLDLEYSYHEEVTITPRHYPFHFRMAESINYHFAMIGMATVINGYPLYYEATNEAGLSMAGLNFPGNAVYHPPKPDKRNLSPFEMIPYILSQCRTVAEAEQLLQQINPVKIPFSPDLPLSHLHWIISDRERSLVAEPMADGLRLHDDPVGILTNNPPFDFHLYNLRNHLNISAKPAQDRFSTSYPLDPFSNGMGGIGLPGDFSSASRFVKAAFVKLNSVPGESEAENVHQFFHILSSVAMPRGSVQMDGNAYEITLYSCCCNTDKGIYYYTTYNNSTITGIDLHAENLDESRVISYSLTQTKAIKIQNR